MKKILLINPPGEKKYWRSYYCTWVSKAKYYYPPLDLVYLSGRLYGKYETYVIDSIAEDLNPHETISRIKKINPDYIIFLLASPSYDEDVKFFTELKKEIPNAEFIGTGDVYRDHKEKSFILNDFLDTILLDFSTNDLLTYLNGRNEGQIIDNIIYKRNGKIFAGPEKHGYGAFHLPIPRWDLFPIDKYIFPFSRRGKFAMILTDFGCPYSCTFCPMSTLGFKLRDIDTVIEEINALKKLGISELFICDQTFGVNKPRTYELCDRIIKENLDISWTCFSRVDTVSEEMIRKIKEAGCHTIMYGLETSNEEVLKEYKKNTKIKQMLDAIELSKKAGLRIVGTFIIGLPGESKESIENTINFATKIGIGYASFNIATPRFGTSLRKDLIAKGLVKEEVMKMDSAKSRPNWKGTEISNDEIFELQRMAVRKFYLRPIHLIKNILKLKSPYEFKEHILEGIALFKN